MLVITDGFDGDLIPLQVASAAAAAEGITTLGIAYDQTPGILVSCPKISEWFRETKSLYVKDYTWMFISIVTL